MPLPIESILPRLREILRGHRAAVLQAPPGAGKTTLVPLALLEEAWLQGRKIVMLEPRRLAARAAARRMAQLRQERVGDTVGYRVRMDTRVGPRTRIEVVTEGVLTRMVQEDPALEGIGLLLFDEFHERSIHADLGLALAREAQAVLRDDLRIVVMSATLDGTAVSRLLDDAPVVASEGRSFPVEIRYLPRREGLRVEGEAAAAVRHALEHDPGDLLVFLPGAGEIRRTEALLRNAALPADTDILPLHGSLPPEAQDAAIAPSRPGRRKVVLATSIAQTSLTIEGVTVVIDAGLSRVPRFSPRTGMARLETVRVSRASAEQRAGRAGRMGPGTCYRLWAAGEQAGLRPHDTPEILEADLAPMALELAAAGIADPATLALLDPPPAAALAQARELLGQLGAIDARGAITAHGRRMAALPLHPRLAHMVLRAQESGAGGLACSLAALLADRDILRGAGAPPESDLRFRVDALREGGARAHGYEIDAIGLRRARSEADDLRRQLRIGDERTGVAHAGAVLAFAYPDRIGQRRPGGGGRYLLRGGGGAVLPAGDRLGDAEYLVVTETDGARPEGRIALAAPVTEEEIVADFADQVEREEVVAWDAAARVVIARRRERLGAIVLRDAPLRDADPAAVSAALLDGIADAGIGALPWRDGSRQLRDRLRFLHALDPSWPDVSDASLAARLHDWLGPFVQGMRRWEEVARVDLTEALMELVPWDRRRQLAELAPTHVAVPSGSRIAIDYSDPASPVLAVRLQELFGLTDTPAVARGAVPLTLHLLSPARRPVQVPRDLAGFWRGSYFDVRKDLRGRYPKHHWPDDPLSAAPTARAKSRPRSDP